MKRGLCLLIILSFFGTGFRCSAAEAYPAVSAYACALYCVNTGEFLMSVRGDERLPMASTTKIMTAILAIEKIQESGFDEVIEITPEMYAEGSSMYLKAGERLKMSDLVGGMLMVSGNDAANAIALSLGGSIDGFADMMNEKARGLKLENTSFVTPSGLDAEGHYTTACDLSKIMAYCMDNEMFREIDSKRSITVEFESPNNKKQTYYNENKLLYKYDYCAAGKTGYTKKAGRTLVSCAEKDGIILTAVTLGDGDDWNDHMKMFDYGFSCLRMEKPDIKFEKITVPVAGGKSSQVTAEVGEQPFVCLREDEDTDVQTIFAAPNFLYAPVKKGDRIGSIEFYKNGVYAGCAEVKAAESVEYGESQTSFVDNVVSFFKRMF